MSKELKIRNSTTEFLIYKSSNGNIKIDALIQNENIWLPQKNSGTFGCKYSCYF